MYNNIYNVIQNTSQSNKDNIYIHPKGIGFGLFIKTNILNHDFVSPKKKSQKYTCIQLRLDLVSTASIRILIIWTWNVWGWNIRAINIWNILVQLSLEIHKSKFVLMSLFSISHFHEEKSKWHDNPAPKARNEKKRHSSLWN